MVKNTNSMLRLRGSSNSRPLPRHQYRTTMSGHAMPMSSRFAPVMLAVAYAVYS